MRIRPRVLPLLVLLSLAPVACATTAARLPVSDVPPGTYVLVEPASDVYNAVAVTPTSFTVRMGNETISGQHWLDRDGRIHMVTGSGECAGMESIWTYSMSGNRITLNKVSDACTTRETPATMVYERR